MHLSHSFLCWGVFRLVTIPRLRHLAGPSGRRLPFIRPSSFPLPCFLPFLRRVACFLATSCQPLSGRGARWLFVWARLPFYCTSSLLPRVFTLTQRARRVRFFLMSSLALDSCHGMIFHRAAIFIALILHPLETANALSERRERSEGGSQVNDNYGSPSRSGDLFFSLG